MIFVTFCIVYKNFFIFNYFSKKIFPHRSKFLQLTISTCYDGHMLNNSNNDNYDYDKFH